MAAGQIVAIVFAAVSTTILVMTFILLRRAYLKKMEQMATVLGVERETASELERVCQLKIPPIPRPAVVRARARPRRRMNHLATGTEVTRLLGAVNPLMPMMPKRAMKCHASVAWLIPMRQAPMTQAATTMSIREPWRSTRRPIRKLDSPAERLRVVCAQPNWLRDMPRAAPMAERTDRG